MNNKIEKYTPFPHNGYDIKLIFEVKSNKNNIYSILLTGDNFGNIFIEGEKKDDLFHIKFKNKLTMEKIRENNHFINFGNIKEIFDDIKEIYDYDNNKIKLIENENNLVFIILPNNGKEINYILTQEKNIYYDKIINLENLISNINNEKEQYKKQLNEIQNNFNQALKGINNHNI